MKKKSEQKLWGGRFNSSTEDIVEQLNASIEFDQPYSQKFKSSIPQNKDCLHLCFFGQKIFKSPFLGVFS